MKFKLLALDVDGTLINDDHLVTEPTREAVREMHRAGATVVLCTGRGANSAAPVLAQLGLEGVMITHNGAVVLDYEKREVLYSLTIEFADIRPVLNYCREKGIHFDLNTPYELYVDRIPDDAKAMYEMFGIVPRFIPDVEKLEEQVVKCTLFGSEEVLDQTEREWDSIGCPLQRSRSGLNFIDIMHPAATKGHALKQMCDDRGITAAEVMAIGNYYNDVEMLEWAGLGVAMLNSPEDVRQRADAVTGGNNEDGVAQAIRAYALSGKP
jgi:Cof subfamily protein (haloacid dehalogenase superfamily)